MHVQLQMTGRSLNCKMGSGEILAYACKNKYQTTGRRVKLTVVVDTKITCSCTKG